VLVCGDLYPLCFIREREVPYGAGLVPFTKVMYNIPGMEGLVRKAVAVPKSPLVSVLVASHYFKHV
jgi:hypothetical protein